MTPAQINSYIAIASAIFDLTGTVAGQIKKIVGIFHPGHNLTDEQINAIEEAGMADALKRAAERRAMGQSS